MSNWKLKFVEISFVPFPLLYILALFSYLFLIPFSVLSSYLHPRRFVRSCTGAQKKQKRNEIIFKWIFFFLYKFCTRAAVKRSQKEKKVGKFANPIEILLCFCKKIFRFQEVFQSTSILEKGYLPFLFVLFHFV